MPIPTYPGQHGKQYATLKQALERHGRVIIHGDALIELRGLITIAENVTLAVPGATLTHNLVADTWELRR